MHRDNKQREAERRRYSDAHRRTRQDHHAYQILRDGERRAAKRKRERLAMKQSEQDYA